MKILRIIARLNVGGPARHVVIQTRHLQDDGFRSWLIAGSVPDGEEGMHYLAEEFGVDPIYIPEMSRELSFKDLISVVKVLRQIRRIRPDILHTHTAKAGAVGRIAGWIYRYMTLSTLIGKPRPLKVVHTFHGHVFHSYYGRAKTTFFIWIERVLARLATDKIVVISDQQFDEIHGEYKIGRHDQFEVIPLGIELGPFRRGSISRDEFRREIGVETDELLIGFVGRLAEIKNVSMLLRAAKRIVDERPAELPRCRFLIVGDGHLRCSLEREARDLGLNGDVIFLGNRTDAEAVYSGLDVVALTSLNEGTPLSLIEAMACGKPVISTAVGGVVDLLGDPRSRVDGFAVCERGISTAANSVDAFVNGLVYLARNEQLRNRIGAEARAFVFANYDKERLIGDTKGLYRRLIGRPELN